MANLRTTLDSAEKQCQLSGTRLTQKRKAVLKGLVKSKHAMTAYELVDYCKEELGESIPAMSVYRILEFLETENLVHKLKLANRYVACTHIACDHQHAVPQFLICTQCYKVEEVDISRATITALRRNVEGAGFELVSEQIELDCICAGCEPA
jgi:Fur family zinc uptake transcriptional regulator